MVGRGERICQCVRLAVTVDPGIAAPPSEDEIDAVADATYPVESDTLDGVVDRPGTGSPGQSGDRVAARSEDEFETAVRALDRILISGLYCVPLFHLPEDLVARWKRVARPEVTAIAGLQPETWWASV